MSTRRNTGQRPTRPRHIARVAAALGLAAAGLTGTLAACADTAPTGPAASGAAYGKTATTTTTATTTSIGVKALTRVTPLASDLTMSFAVPAAGGTYAWPAVGLTIKVPAGAVPAAGLTISVKALKGDVIAYDFGPDGSRFAAPLTMTQSLAGTNYAQVPDYAQVQGAYFKSATQIDKTTKTATVDELQPTVVDLAAQRVDFQVSHFSGYMVSTGRTK